ncbi:MAG: hypothetical protein JW723_10415 [Bacteroidales bacterium]|nr:hypothetical protein [Bacteroidales bacterium]
MVFCSGSVHFLVSIHTSHKLKIESIYIYKRIISSLFLLVFSWPVITAQEEHNFSSGARVSGLSGAGTVMTDLWSNYHNQAGLAGIEDFTVGFHYENKFAFSSFSLQSFAMAIPTKSGTIGGNMAVFGNPGYFESKISLAFGKPFGKKFAAGIQLDMLGIYQSHDYGNVVTLAAEGGIMAKPTEKITLGLYVYNPTGAHFKEFTDKEVPVIFEWGLGYQITEKLLFVTEAEKKIGYRTVVIAGTEYYVLNSVCARAGVSTFKYSNYSFGIGFKQKRIRADLAFSEHKTLGYSSHFSLSYSF